MPRFGLSGDEEYAPGIDCTVFFSGAESIQGVRHVNSAREAQRLQKILSVDRENRRRSAEIVGLDFEARLSEHRAKFSPKIRDVSILERCLNAVTIDSRDAPVTVDKPMSSQVLDQIRVTSGAAQAISAGSVSVSNVLKPSPQISQKQKLISSTPLPTSTANIFSIPSTSTLSPIPNIDNIPRFRDSLATPLFKSIESSKAVHSTPLIKESVKLPPSRNLHEALARSKLGSVEEERIETVKPTAKESHVVTSTSVTPSSTRPPSVTDDSPSMKTPDEGATPPLDEEWSLSNIYYSDVVIELNSYLDDARMFEARSGITTRSLIKRSILEKVTVTSKRHAATEEKDCTSNFFSRLLSMEEVDGFNNETLRLRDKLSIHYAMTLIVEHYLSLLERDSSLADTISYVLYSLSCRSGSFSTFLSASLLSRSPSLDMDKRKCHTMVDGILEDPQTLLDVMARERAVCSLFYGLHSWSSKKPIKDCPFPLSSIWRILARTLNRAPLLLATPFTLSEILKACGAELQSKYGIQMEKMIELIQEKLLPQLERDLETSNVSRRAGNAAYISALRSTIDLLNIS